MKTLLHLFLLVLCLNYATILIPGQQCDEDEQSSLLHFKQSLIFNSSYSSKLISWNSSTDCCSWLGVTCGSNGRVVGLDVSDESISGPLPSSFANFSNLRVFNFDFNNISAPLPGFFANFSKLTSLSLVDCGLQGTFPKQIFQVPTLQTIDLSYNEELHGSFPEFPKNGSLQSVLLGATNFGGILPDSIGNLKMLSKLYLNGGCSFTGHIPQSMGNLTQLAHLGMSSNKFIGPIDSIDWENLNNLVYLELDDNLLNGSIPSSIFSPPMLEDILLSHNLFSGLHEFSNVSSNLSTIDLSSNNLEGAIPVSIFNFRGLRALYLSSNNFSAFPFNGPQQPRNLSFLDLSWNRLLIPYNATNSSFSSFLQIGSLFLASNNLRTFPDFLKNQTNLERLDLSDNQIQGKIPNWIWRLNSLYDLNLSSNSLVALEVPLLLNFTSGLSKLDLHSNQLLGKIPIFSPLPQYLDYSSNRFNSSIPTNIGKFLNSTRFFSISSNNLHGRIPMSLCNASQLELLDLSNNSLSGTVPQCFTATSGLKVLNLGRNNLTGIISHFKFPDNCDLETLDLYRNQIEGQFPKSLANCRRLQFLNLGKNHITDTFPCLLNKISTLRVLGLRSNKFYGRIGCPWTNGTWPLLHIIDLAHNNFNGEIPGKSLITWRAMIKANDDSLVKDSVRGESIYTRGMAYFPFEEGIKVTSKGSERDLVKILSFLTLIDFSCNKFNGSIPKEMGEFKSLYVLNLSNNAFTGEIPSTFGKMRVLESLDLSQNKLSGEIPQQLAKLTFLAFLNLSNNQLVGRIPSGTQFSTFPAASFTGNKGLWGPPLTVDEKAGFSPPTLNGSLPNSGHQREINWDVISVEIGFAVGFGIAIGSLALYKRWSKWYYKTMYNMVLKLFPQLEERIGHHRRHIHINQRRGR